jgi:drug/metabolite transporter (DMT)-like permease
VCGLTGVALYYGLQNLGLRFATPDSAALLQAALPVLTVGLGVLWLGEAISVRRVVCLGLSVLGILLVVGRGDRGVGRIGDTAILGGVAAYALFTAYVRRIVVDTDPLVLASAANLWGLVFLAPWLLWEISTKGPGSMSLHAGLALAYLGVMASALTLFLWTFALRKVPASVAGVFAGAIPAVGYVFALFTGESFAWSRLAGGALAVAGVTLSSIDHRIPARTDD